MSSKKFHRKVSLALTFLMCVCLTDGARSKRMEGRHFRAVACESPVGLKPQISSNGTIVGYSGSFASFFDWLSKRLKFTYTTVSVVNQVTDSLPNGSFVGAYGLLMKKEVDFSICPVWLNPRIYAILDVTPPFGVSSSVLLTPSPKEESRLLVPVKPFTFTVWMVLLCCTALLSVAILWVHSFKYKLAGKRDPRLKLRDIAISITSVTFGQAEFPLDWSRTLCLRMIITSFCLSLVVLTNSYTGSFISFATTPKLIPLAETVEDVSFHSNLRWVGTYAQNFDALLDSKRPALVLLVESVKKNPEYIFRNAASAAEKVATGCCAFLYPRRFLNTWLSNDLKKQGYCRCMITKQVEDLDYFAFGTQKGSPYKEPMSIAVLEALEYGLTDGWLRNELKVPERCYKAETPKIRPLKLSDLSGIFVLYLGGVSFSITLFIFEKIKHYRASSSKVRQKPDA